MVKLAKTGPRQRGFALVITLALLALLVLAVYALSGLTRVGSQIAMAGVYQMKARQHAQLGMNLALSELQSRTGGGTLLTGMAGIAGVPAGLGNPARQWCGVWSGAGTFRAWLVSGVSGPAIPALGGNNAIEIVSTNSVGAEATDREHVKVLRVALTATDILGGSTVQGGYAYWVGDEGVKLSTVLPDTETVIAGQKHAINQQFTAVTPTNSTLLRNVVYEQITFSGGTTAQRQGGFHTYTRTHYGLVGGKLTAGLLNVNSTSVRYWTGLGATFVRLNPTAGAPLSLSGFATAAAGLAGRPFQTVDDFLTGIAGYLASHGIPAGEFRTTMRPWLCVRSDTFRLRAYGDAVNPVDTSKIEATAFCEMIVQRTPAAAGGGMGQKYSVILFRWLGPDDL